MRGHRQHIARMQSDLYRNYYRKILILLLLSCFITLCVLGGIVYVILSKPSINYYATTTSGKIIPMPQ